MGERGPLSRGIQWKTRPGIQESCCDEWNVRHAPTRDFIVEVDICSAGSFRDLFAVPLTNGSNIRFGKLTGAFRLHRWIPRIAARSSRRAKIHLDGRAVAFVDLHPPVRNTNSNGINLAKYRLRYVRETSAKDRMVVIGLCLVIARETLP